MGPLKVGFIGTGYMTKKYAKVFKTIKNPSIFIIK